MTPAELMRQLMNEINQASEPVILLEKGFSKSLYYLQPDGTWKKGGDGRSEGKTIAQVREIGGKHWEESSNSPLTFQGTKKWKDEKDFFKKYFGRPFLTNGLKESLSYWSGLWVHYSNHPMITINPKQFHQDPAGIYFFPEEFDTNGIWHKYEYKYVAKIKPDANILDLSNVSKEHIIEILKKASPDVYTKFLAHLEMYPPANDYKFVDAAWEKLVAYYSYESGNGRILSSFNKLFRSFGYDAIFDDTKSVHIAEVQLIVLNPSIIKLVDVQKRKGTGFYDMQNLLKMVVDECEKYGVVEVSPPKKTKTNSWGEIETKLVASVKVEDDKNRYAIIMLESEMPKDPIIRGYIRYSRPSMGSSSFTYDVTKKKLDNFDRFSQDLAHGFRSN